MMFAKTRLKFRQDIIVDKINGELCVHYLFQEFGKAGEDGYGTVTVWVRNFTSFEKGLNESRFPVSGDDGRFQG